MSHLNRKANCMEGYDPNFLMIWGDLAVLPQIFILTLYFRKTKYYMGGYFPIFELLDNK